MNDLSFYSFKLVCSEIATHIFSSQTPLLDHIARSNGKHQTRHEVCVAYMQAQNSDPFLLDHSILSRGEKSENSNRKIFKLFLLFEAAKENQPPAVSTAAGLNRGTVQSRSRYFSGRRQSSSLAQRS